MGGFDTTGKPDDLTEDIISPSLMSFIDSLLPALATSSFANKNLVKSHPELFVNSAINDIIITKPSDVYMTFVSQGPEIKIQLVFTHTLQGNLL
ncbi:MAG: hypothetical protein M3R50_10100 [Bacteroidota bacterium]|nr:hypothetical protein [Bacteroidota bacterium]